MRCNKIVVANSRNLWLVVFSRQHQKQSIYSIIKAIRKKTPCSRRNTILIGVKKRKIYIVDFLWIQIITEEILCKYFFNGHSKHTRNNMKRHCPHIYLYVYKHLLLNMICIRVQNWILPTCTQNKTYPYVLAFQKEFLVVLAHLPNELVPHSNRAVETLSHGHHAVVASRTVRPSDISISLPLFFN